MAAAMAIFSFFQRQAHLNGTMHIRLRQSAPGGAVADASILSEVCIMDSPRPQKRLDNQRSCSKGHLFVLQ